MFSDGVFCNFFVIFWLPMAPEYANMQMFFPTRFVILLVPEYTNMQMCRYDILTTTQFPHHNIFDALESQLLQ
jgi:hypothetical protein